MAGNAVGWRWFDHASDAEIEAFFWFIFGLGLAGGLVVWWSLWQTKGRARNSSVALACIAAQLPMVQFCCAVDGALGNLEGWVIGYAVFAPLACCACMPVSLACHRAASWGQTCVVAQGLAFAILVRDWLVITEGLGLLSLVWSVDRLCRPDGWWDAHAVPWLERWSVQSSAVLATAYPLFAWSLLTTGVARSDALDAYLLHHVPEDATGFAAFLGVFALGVTIARTLSGRSRSAVVATMWPLAIWFVALNAVPEMYTGLATWGFIFAVIFVLSAVATAVLQAPDENRARLTERHA